MSTPAGSVPVLSVVVPVYYNQETLVELHQKLDDISRLIPDLKFEFVFVDDGSGDRSFAVLQGLAARDARVKVIKLSRNFGSNIAILAGMAHASGDAVAFVAADLQDPPEMLLEMIKAWREGEKVIFAVRQGRDDPFVSRLFANLFNTLFHRLVLSNAPPSGVGFFLVDRQVSDIVVRCEEKNAHLINLIIWLGFHPRTLLYNRSVRLRGKSRWTFSRKVKYAIDTFVAFSYLPIRLASLSGVILALIGVMAIAYVIFARLFLNVYVEGWASLMVVLLIVSGMQNAILGVLGEYLWRNLDQTRKRPLFVVDTVIKGAAEPGRQVAVK